MGFDIECIIDIHTYPGEYFCPVCRTLVYPNEAFQAQCTHLYCKPCLAHIANGSKACPYDGYLVTESDSKQLKESDKALAESIGKVKVHCLYFRSGCTWEGPLSDCTSHCSGCSFGNSPVICNRCGIQIVHREVHDHAQSCPGVLEGQQAVGSVSGLTKSGATSTATAEVNPTVSQSGTPLPQGQNPQNVSSTIVPGQNLNQQANASSQAAVVAPAAVPTPEQWYQQQYQHYYQQYGGYDPYQQTNQQYYTLHQQQYHQYQQQPMQAQAQHQSHVYSQTASQQHPQQPQSNPVPLAPQQLHLQSQAQGQVQSQSQPQLQQLPQAQPQLQVPPQGQPHINVPNQALAPNYQVNLQQQPHPPMRPQSQIPPHSLPPPPSSQSTQPPPFAHAVGMRPSAQQPQGPQYQQPHVQMHHPQPPQANVQAQMHPQPQPHIQPSNQLHGQIQPQAQPYHTQSQHPMFAPQANHSTAPAALPQAPNPPVHPVSGHHSYQQTQPAQKMQSGVVQQHPVHPHPASGSLHPVQVHGQGAQQPPVMRPPNPHGSLPPQQPSAMLPPQNQSLSIPPAQHQQFPPHAQQPTHPPQHRPFMQPVQQGLPQHYAQQQQFVAPFQSQLHQHGHHQPQQPVQPYMRPSGPPQPQQPQTYVGRPVMPNQGIQPQNHPFPSGGSGPPAHPGPTQPPSAQTSINQNYAKSTVLEQNPTLQETRPSPSKGLLDKGAEGESVKEEAVTVQNGTVIQDANGGAGDGLIKPVIKQEADDVLSALEQPSAGKSFELAAKEDDKKEGNLLANSDSLKQGDLENQKLQLSKSATVGDKQPHTAVSASSTEGHLLHSQSHGSHQQMFQAQAQRQPSAILGPQGPGIMPHPGQSLNPTEGRMPGNFGPPPNSFESQTGPQGPAAPTVADPLGIMGKAPSLRFEGQYGPQQVVRPGEVAILKDQMSGSVHSSASGEGGQLMKNPAADPSFLRRNGETAPDSSVFGSRDEKTKTMSWEHLNPFAGEPSRAVDQAAKSLDKAPHMANYDAGLKLDPSALGPHSRFLPHHPSGGHGPMDMFGPGSELGQHHMKHFAHRSPDREYLGSSPRGFGGSSGFPRGTSTFDDINSREALRFGEGSRSFNLSADPVGNPFRDGRLPPMSGYQQRGEIDGPGNPRFGEHMAPGPLHNQVGSDDVFGPDRPGHLMRGKFPGPGYLPGHFNMPESAGPGAFPGHGRPGELGGPANFPRPPFTESVRGDRSSFPHFGEHAMRNTYSLPGYPNAGNFAGGMDSFDQSRKRKPVSTGWCRICELDCETVEGLDMHSQTREHQQMAMDMVRSIKLQNKKKRRTSSYMPHEGGSRSRKGGGRGNKP
ncbi:Non-specific serine/threonine protein kinase [Handroanthus impetiginosus]|uniref:Non-specific serine/threonine protein kinase n=1 Tax=Handroanthus impetiginosus TaxID=429701 RepID=A0A2G9HD29_9LAMI|nr:Non-specific serine/threonine protein kinase [Handroanthus impetiginosus]